MFAADVKIGKGNPPQGTLYRGQRAVTLVLVVLSLAAVVWAFAISFEQAKFYELRVGLEEVKTTASNE